MKIKYKLKNESVQSPEYGQNKAGEPDGAAGNRYANPGMEEGIVQSIKGKLGTAKSWAAKKLGMQKPKNPDEYAGITGYLGRLHDKTSQQVSTEVMNIVRTFASKQFANDPNKAKQYITAKKAALQALLLDDSADPNSYKDFPEEAKKILNNYYNVSKPVQKPSTEKPLSPPPPPKDDEDVIEVGPEDEPDKPPLTRRGQLGQPPSGVSGIYEMKIKYKLHKSIDEEKGESPNENPDMDDDGVYSPAELEYHFDLDQDGEVTPDEYKDHVKWHEKHPEVFEVDENVLGEEKPCWKGYEQIGMKVKSGKKVPNCVPVKEEYMATLEEGSPVCEACLYETILENKNILSEAEYQGRSVPLGKPMKGDVKKFKVYVRDPKTGNVKKVNFGDKKMRIKKSNPARRKSFRARHNCANPGPRTKARYWSCRKW